MMIVTMKLGGDGIVRLYAGIQAEAGDAPKWSKLFPVGVTKYRSADFGKLELTREFFDKMIANWIAAGRPQKQINYDHTIGKAAGWITDLKIEKDPDDGKEWVYSLNKWNAAAAQLIKADEYRYISPEFVTNAESKATGQRQGPTLFGAALTNIPFLEELPKVAASENHNEAAKAAGATNMREKLIALFALALTATDEDILKCAETQKTKLGEAETAKKDLETKLSDATSKIQMSDKQKSDEVKKLSDRIATLEQEKHDTALTSLCDQLVKDGKVLPTQVDRVKKMVSAIGVTETAAYFKDAPVVVKLNETGVAAGAELGKDTAAAQKRLDDRIAEIRKQDPKLKFDEAHRLAMSEMQELSKVLFSDIPTTKPAPAA